MKIIVIPVFIGFVLDLIFGDKPNPYHMIRLLGHLISFLEKRIRSLLKLELNPSKIRALFGGCLLVLLTITFYNLPIGLLLWASFQISPYLYYGIAALICYQMIALKDLKEESLRVYLDLKSRDVQAARYSLSMIVGRDTTVLDEDGIIKASIETIAENSSDGVIAPLFYMFLLGPLGGTLYKSVNTLDSMVGYMNEKYLYFGRCSAKLDDLVNFIPARISSLLMWLSGLYLGCPIKGAWRIFWRDRRKHHSPNAGLTEAMMAGLLSIQLAGDAIYHGQIKKKPFIGDLIKPVELKDIKVAHQLLYGMSFIGFILGLLIHFMLILT